LSATAAAARPPNIVFIMLDDLGYGDVGCYGQEKILTPNIDRLSREGMRFTDCYAGGSVCAPSRSVLMTGFHAGHTSVRANAGTVPLLPGDVTVAQVLQSAGYATGGFGKWGLGDVGTTGVPSKHGFDEFFGYLHQIHAHSYYPEFLWRNEQKYPLPGNRNNGRKQYSADLIADHALQFVRDNKDKPFFLYATYTLPHGRYEVPSVAPYSEKNWPPVEKTYAAMITRADRQVGDILALLKELRLEDNTIVFFTSDNGGTGGSTHDLHFFHSNGPLRGQKGQLYEGGIRVPMIVRWPARIQPGSVNSFPWAFCDFMPTAAELAGVKPPAGIDGISVLPTLRGGRQTREFLYWEHHQFDRKRNELRLAAMAQAARMGGWKAVRRKPGSPLELYNLRADIGETKDLAARNPSVVKKLESYLRTAHTKPRPHTGGSFEFAT
jgi:arylsulfatase A-like enzyme